MRLSFKVIPPLFFFFFFGASCFVYLFLCSPFISISNVDFCFVFLVVVTVWLIISLMKALQFFFPSDIDQWTHAIKWTWFFFSVFVGVIQKKNHDHHYWIFVKDWVPFLNGCPARGCTSISNHRVVLTHTEHFEMYLTIRLCNHPNDSPHGQAKATAWSRHIFQWVKHCPGVKPNQKKK